MVIFIKQLTIILGFGTFYGNDDEILIDDL